MIDRSHPTVRFSFTLDLPAGSRSDMMRLIEVCLLLVVIRSTSKLEYPSPRPNIGVFTIRLKSASGGFGCYFGTTPQFEIPTRPNRNIFRNSQNLFLIA